MSPKELYEWAVANNVENENIGLYLSARRHATEIGIDTKMLVIRETRDPKTKKLKPWYTDISEVFNISIIA